MTDQTKEYAIELLEQQKIPYPEYYKDTELNDVIDMAIEALKQQMEESPKRDAATELHEINKTLKEILREMRKRKV